MKEELVFMLLSESATITALVDEIEYGDNEPTEFLEALRQIGYRLKVVAKELDGETLT
jgi:hypothetical protein